MNVSEMPSQEKWKNVSFQGCKAVYDVLAELESVGSLPEGKTVDDKSIQGSQDIMDYAERVLADEKFWASVLEEIPIKSGTLTKIRKKEELKEELAGYIREAK